MSLIKSILSQLSLDKGSFVRNLAVFTGGSFLAYLIGFFFTPVITRIYSPEDYGLFSFFNASVGLLSSIALLGYNEALILPETNRKFYRMSGLLISLSVGLALVIAVSLPFFGSDFSRFFSVEGLEPWLWLLPIMVVLQAMYRISSNFLIREKYYERNGHARVSAVLGNKSLVTILGLTQGSTIWGFLLGELTSRIIGILVMLRDKIWSVATGIARNLSLENLKSIAREYREYPLRIFPSTLVLQLALHVPIFVIGRAYDSEFLGYFSLAYGLLQIPIQVIGFSMGTVFLQKLNELWKDNIRDISKQMLKFYIGVLSISTLTYAGIFGFGEVIFKYFAGEEWILSGTIAQYLAFPLSIQLTVVAVSPVFRVLRKEKMLFNTNLSSTFIFLFFVFSPWIFELDSMTFILVLAAGLWLRQLIGLVFALRVARVNVLPVALISFALIGVVFFLTGFIANYVISFFNLL